MPDLPPPSAPPPTEHSTLVDTNDVAIAEVIVEARRRAENLQQVRSR
jgi:hypothetical protein